MKKRKLAILVGARPQFIKAAPLCQAIIQSRNLSGFIIHSGQHYDENMSGIFFKELDIDAPQFNLNVGSHSHATQSAQILERIEPILLETNPDLLVVFGDTNTTLAGAICAAKLNIPVAHIEAGLRSFNKAMPEEINRVVADHCSELLFAPTTVAMENLKKENLEEKSYLVGDIMYDAILKFQHKIKEIPLEQLAHIDPKIVEGGYIVSTIHRAESTDSVENLETILRALHEVNRRYAIVFPIHPRTRRIISKSDTLSRLIEPIITTPPLGYLGMIKLISNAKMVITDSGGLQKEAYFVGKACVTVRNETEWTELVDIGANIITGYDQSNIINAVNHFASRRVTTLPLYGEGNSARKIISKIEEYLNVF